MKTKVIILMMAMVALCISGCSSLSSTLADRGNGKSKVYQVTLDELWSEMPTVITLVGLEYVRADKEDRYMLAERKASGFTWGEYVAIFYTPEGQQTSVEIVAKPALYTNVTSAYWTWPDTIFTEMDKRWKR